MTTMKWEKGEVLSRLRGAGIEVVRESAGPEGQEAVCRCPRHDDPDGHLYVNKLSGLAFCHRCHMGTTLEKLRRWTGLGFTTKPMHMNVLEAAACYYQNKGTPESIEYLMVKRQLPEMVLEAFRIGWADGGLSEHLVKERGFPVEVCLESGLIRRVRGRLIDFFKNCMVFPHIYECQAVNLTGRRIGRGGNRWLHLPGAITQPYNVEALLEPDCVWVEGIIDALSFEAVGMPAVAGLGTRIPPQWMGLIPRDGRLTICLDGDAAGRKACLGLAKALDYRVRIARLPAGRDPNDLLTLAEPQMLLQVIEAAQDPIAYQIESIPRDVPSPELAVKLEPIMEQLASMDNVRAEVHLRQVAERFSFDAALTDEYRRAARAMRRASERIADSPVYEGSQAEYLAQFDGLVDIVEHDGLPAFLLLEDGDLSITSSTEVNGHVVFPPPAEKLPWLLPRADEVLKWYGEDDGCLFDDLVQYHREASELPSEDYYDLLALWDMHTYLLEHFEYSPIITLYAVPERGKTRTGKAMIYVAYRGYHVESFNEPYIVRITQYCGGSMFFDTMRGWAKAFGRGSEDIILHRFERGARVTKVNHPDRPPFLDIDHYSVFGSTVIATNVPSHPILDTRSLTITMPSSTRVFESDVTSEAGRALQERLVAFRARHMTGSLPDVPKPEPGRLGDITRPLLQVLLMVRPERESAFRQLISGLRDERLAERRASLEADILRALSGLRSQVVDGAVPVKAVTDSLNGLRRDAEPIKPQLVGKRLRALGFRAATRAAVGARVVWDEKMLLRALNEWGLWDIAQTAHSAPDLEP